MVSTINFEFNFISYSLSPISAFFAILNHLSLILLPSDKDSNIHTMMGESEEAKQFRQKILMNPAYVEAVQQWLPFYHNKGIFDFDIYNK